MRSIFEHDNYLDESEFRYRGDAPSYMHSLYNIRELIIKLIETTKIKSICEIGSEEGFLTEIFHELYKSGKIEKLTIIDPFPSDIVRTYNDEDGCIVDTRLSIEALGDVAAHDLYIVDGDHNYYTVIQELRYILSNKDALVIMHDIAWPCARRDFYFDPETIPEDQRHPYAFKGSITPANQEIVESGLGTVGQYALSKHTGGPRNGVFSALKDISQEFDLSFNSLPALLGVGFVRRRGHQFDSAIDQLFPSDFINPLLWRLEENRIRNFIKIQQLNANVLRLKKKEEELDIIKSGRLSLLSLSKILAKKVVRKFIRDY